MRGRVGATIELSIVSHVSHEALNRGEPHTTVPELECIFAYTTLLGTLIEYGVSDTDRRGTCTHSRTLPPQMCARSNTHRTGRVPISLAGGARQV